MSTSVACSRGLTTRVRKKRERGVVLAYLRRTSGYGRAQTVGLDPCVVKCFLPIELGVSELRVHGSLPLDPENGPDVRRILDLLDVHPKEEYTDAPAER